MRRIFASALCLALCIVSYGLAVEPSIPTKKAGRLVEAKLIAARQLATRAYILEVRFELVLPPPDNREVTAQFELNSRFEKTLIRIIESCIDWRKPPSSIAWSEPAVSYALFYIPKDGITRDNKDEIEFHSFKVKPCPKLDAK